MEEYLAKIAKEKLNEIPERKEKDLIALKQWILKQPHLIARTDDKFLISFLRNSEYRLEATKQNIDSYHAFRTNCPEFFQNRVPLKPNEYTLLKKGTYLPLLQPHPKDCGRIVMTIFKKMNESNCNLSDILKLAFMINDKYLITDDCTTVIGQHSIVDLEGTNMITATQAIAIANKLVAVVENVYPIQIIDLHLINLNKAPPIFEMVIKTYQGLCPTKLGEKIRIHDTLESLYKEIPKSILPKEYGGDAGTTESLMKIFLDSQNFNDEKWFLNDQKYKTDESKRVDGLKLNALFGSEGSFRQLNID